MLTLKGKYNFAHIMTDNPDETTISQIINLLNHPVFKGVQIRVMADCHAGAGCVVGFTSELPDAIIPNLVGVDIGCGIYSWNLGKLKIDYENLDNIIRKNIPSGFSIRSEFYEYDNHHLFEVEYQVKPICKKIGIDYSKAIKAYGTLGGGNHFIELGQDPDENLWLTIHSGSRNFGWKVAEYWQKQAKELARKMHLDAFKNLEFLPMEFGGKKYLDDMLVAQQFAHYNRIIMMNIIMKNLGIDVSPDNFEHIYSIHNYIDPEDNIIRKGAISAYAGRKCVIPFNMRDGIAVCTGKGSKKWNNSAPHGAGRIFSRGKAKAEIPMELYTESMKGIWSSCISESTLDESPFAYKDYQQVIEDMKETVDVDFLIKPVYNFKAS